jgi:putative acetyltransferase
MLLRSYRSTDAPALAKLYERSVHHYGPRGYSPAQVAAWAAAISTERLAEHLGDGRLALVAVADDGTYLGFADLEVDGHIDLLYAAPEAEGLRLGTFLLTALEDAARRHGLTELYVEASELARPLFLRHGFTLRGRNDLLLGSVPIHNYRLDKTL